MIPPVLVDDAGVIPEDDVAAIGVDMDDTTVLVGWADANMELEETTGVEERADDEGE